MPTEYSRKQIKVSPADHELAQKLFPHEDLSAIYRRALRAELRRKLHESDPVFKEIGDLCVMIVEDLTRVKDQLEAISGAMELDAESASALEFARALLEAARRLAREKVLEDSPRRPSPFD